MCKHSLAFTFDDQWIETKVVTIVLSLISQLQLRDERYCRCAWPM